MRSNQLQSNPHQSQMHFQSNLLFATNAKQSRRQNGQVGEVNKRGCRQNGQAGLVVDDFVYGMGRQRQNCAWEAKLYQSLQRGNDETTGGSNGLTNALRCASMCVEICLAVMEVLWVLQGYCEGIGCGCVALVGCVLFLLCAMLKD